MECTPFCEPVHIRLFALADKSGHVHAHDGQHARIFAQELRHRSTRTGPDDGPGRRQVDKKKACREAGFFEDGSPGWIRTTECLSQSQVPYRLATGL